MWLLEDFLGICNNFFEISRKLKSTYLNKRKKNYSIPQLGSLLHTSLLQALKKLYLEWNSVKSIKTIHVHEFLPST